MGFSVFCCCGANRKETTADIDDINENSRLIPPAEEPLPPTTTFDYGKYEQRLGTIVRSMEGRMVNVNTPGVFDDLQNADSAATGDDEPGAGVGESSSRASSRTPVPKDIHVQPAPPSNLNLTVGSLSRSWGD